MKHIHVYVVVYTNYTANIWPIRLICVYGKIKTEDDVSQQQQKKTFTKLTHTQHYPEALQVDK